MARRTIVARDLARANGFLRQWRLLLALRRGSKTITDLAAELRCSTRTVRRDLHVLHAAGLPIDRQHDDPRQPALWSLGATSAWPRGVELPVASLEGAQL